MPIPTAIDEIRARKQSQAGTLARDLLICAEKPASIGEYLSEVLPSLLSPLAADFVAVAAVGQDPLGTIAEAGLHQSWPPDLVADCRDREEPLSQDAWIAAPLAARESSGEVLLVHRAGDSSKPSSFGRGQGEGAANSSRPGTLTPTLSQGEREQCLADLESFAIAIGAGLRIVRARQRLARRAVRSETILSIVQQWGRTQEMETLLNQMAEASTQLLEADRASIFLWDKPNHMLVGRPALGVPGGELRVPDDAGVVGEVLRTGAPEEFRTARRTIR